MSMFPTTEEEDLFNPTLNSNLASLFGTSMAFKQDGDTSLTYTAPKQPRASGQGMPKTSPKPTTQSTVVCSKVVDVFKLSDKSHTSQGKCGLAIIGNQSLKAYEIIVYKSKQNIITRAKLKLDFTFTIQNNNFAYFCDDQKQRWSIHFENTKEVNEFVQEIKTHGGKIVCDIKNADSSDTSRSVADDTGTTTQQTASNIISERDNDSDSTSSSSNNQTKANILSRMAKMGQSILPINLPEQSSDHSGSETDEQAQNRKPIKKRQKFVTSNGESPSDRVKNTNNLPINVPTPPTSDFVVINGQVVPIAALQQTLPSAFSNPMYNQYNLQNIPNQLMLSQPQPQVTPMMDSMHVFIAENRTHNCEMRMNMSQLTSKLDKVLSQFHKNDPSCSTKVPEIVSEMELKFSDKAGELEESLRIINDLQEQQNKLEEDIISNNRLIDNLKEENETQKNFILKYEQKITQLEKDKSLLEEQLAQDKFLQQNLEEAQQTVYELKQTLNNQQEIFKKMENLSLENKENQHLPVVIDQLNQEIINLKSQLDDKNSKTDLFSRKLKQAMNLLYQQIMENFEDQNLAFQSAHIKQILSHKLKAAAFTLIQEFQNDFKDAEATPSMHGSDITPSVPQFE